MNLLNGINGLNGHSERAWLGPALLLCIAGYIALVALGRAPADGALTNLAFALVGGIAGVSMPSQQRGAVPLLSNSPGSTISVANTDATDSDGAAASAPNSNPPQEG